MSATGRVASWIIDLSTAGELILAARASTPRQRALLVGISGIDGSGKGFVAERLATRLSERGLRVANVNVDGGSDFV